MFIRNEIAHELLLLAEAMVGEGITRRDALPASFRREKVVPYRTSWRRYAGGALFLARTPDEKVLVTIGEGDPPFYGEVLSVGGCRLGVHPMSGANAAVLRQLMPFTAPAKLPPAMPSFGCGDRLGLANPGHLRALGNYRVALVLAQQSIRELNLTGRCFGEVIDAATWAVLQEGYERGFGADGDHLKNLEEVRLMLAAGATMVTLDLSLTLNEAGQDPCPDELMALSGQTAACDGIALHLGPLEIGAFWRKYGKAVHFIRQAHECCREFRGEGRFDLEISVDETPDTTSPVEHFLLTATLGRLGIRPFSVAPRFPGEFQKGVDYRGDLGAFEAEFAAHAAVARRFGHKLSIHSGSDKFAVFPIIGRLSRGAFHEKTAGTSWLEAMRVAASADPGLFRRICRRAEESFADARKYYHISTDLKDIPEFSGIPDRELASLLENDAVRQFLHITYGHIMKDEEIGPVLRRLLFAHERAYLTALKEHFRRHAAALGLTEDNAGNRSDEEVVQ